MKNIFTMTIIWLMFSHSYAQNKPNASIIGNAVSAVNLKPVDIYGVLKLNLITSYEPLVPVKTASELSTVQAQISNCRMINQYSDGIGRNIQSVVRGPTIVGKDLVTHQCYDAFGRPSIGILPFAKSTNAAAFTRNISSELQAAYTSLGYSGETFLYKKAIYEASPLNRVIETQSQGNSWVGNDKGVKILTAWIISPPIIKYTISDAVNSIPVANGNYAKLLQQTTTDEDYDPLINGKRKKISYYNQRGLLISDQIEENGTGVKLLTYYVYDEFDQLRYTIPPKGVDAIASNSGVISTEISDKLCFISEFDDEGRTVISKKPGIERVYIVYDKLDRQILTQEPLQKNNDKWTFTKYDEAGKIIQTGTFIGTYTSNMPTSILNPNGSSTSYLTGTTVPFTRIQLQNLVNSGGGGQVFLTYLVNTKVREFSQYQTSFTNAEILLTYLFDDYNLVLPFGTTIGNTTEGYLITQSAKTNGKLTGFQSKTSNGGITSDAYYYNERGELIQKVSKGLNGLSRYLAQGFDFKGRLIKTLLMHNNQFVIYKKITYDSYSRLTKIEHKINNGSNYRPIARYYYDDLGRMSIRKLGAMGYNVNYEYNIRNWITGINKDYALVKNSIDYFGMEISYDKGFDKTYLNGQISGLKWRNKGTNTDERTYGYEYNFAGQLTLADYYQKTEINPNGWLKIEKDFTTSNLNYDANGNITSMKHMGINKAKQIIILDDLNYSYLTNSNLLDGVSESTGSQSKDPSIHDGFADFRDVGSTGSSDYSYDANGNRNSDLNKDIINVDYNWFGLNKPIKVEFGNSNKIEYVYDGLGNLLRKKITQFLNNKITIYDYVDEVTYKNGAIEIITQQEGRIRVDAVNNTYTYDYFIKDHIDNVRSIITEAQVSTWGTGPTLGNIAWPSSSGSVAGSNPTESGMVAPINGGATNVQGLTPQPILYLATSEIQNDPVEDELFDHIDDTRANRPLSNDSNNLKAAKLNPGEGKILGPGIILKVMAGDQMQLGVEALYFNATDPGNPISLQSIVESIVSSLSGSGGALEGIGAGSQVANIDATAMTLTINQIQNSVQDTTKPRAFLNYLFFDENMNLIADQSGALQVSQANAWQTIAKTPFTITRNGFIYVYTVNGSQSTVRTDNLYVMHYQGSLLEEFHYYPYGLCFDVSHAANISKTSDVKYNCQYLEQNEFVDAAGADYGLDYYDFAARSYDPQIGRWMQPDPMMQHASPYLAMNNNPVSFVDPLGLQDGEKPKSFNDPDASSGYGFYIYPTFSGWDIYNNITDPFNRADILMESMEANKRKMILSSNYDMYSFARQIRDNYAKDMAAVEASNGKYSTHWMQHFISEATIKEGLKSQNSWGSTWDPLTNKRISKLDFRLRKPAVNFINDSKLKGVNLRITQGLRTIDEQDALYNQGRTTPGAIVTNARGGESYHNYGLAFDVVIMQNGRALIDTPISTQIGNSGVGFGFEWGGNWSIQSRDFPHFQMTFGQSILSLQKH